MGGFNRYKYKIICVAVVGIAVIAATLGLNKMEGSKTNEKDSQKIKVGLSMDSLVVERWQYDRDIFMAKARELGAEVIVQNASNDSDEQINQIKYLMNQDVDVLVIVPNDSEALAPVIAMAKKKGIKIICYDRIIRKGAADLYVAFDNKNVGELMAGAIVRNAPQGNYIIINGNKKDYNAVQYNEGFNKVLKPFIDKGDIKVVKEVWAKNWREEDAYNCVEEAISGGIKIDAIIAGNDSLAEAAIQVLAEHRLAGKVAVVGQDSALTGCQRIVEGLQVATIYKPIKALAQDAAIAAVKMGKGEKVKTNIMINDGLAEVPVLMEESVAVDKENMVAVVVNNNFHRLEDIYRNVPQINWPKENTASEKK